MLIKAQSPGPVIFRQRRIGYRGRPFTMYKLRTMQVLRQGTYQITTDGDRRITKER